LASEARLPVPTVSKILKTLARAGLLVAHRGVKGGFSLARRPEEISMAQIISAMEGPIAITECSDNVPGICELEPWCPVGANWQRSGHGAPGTERGRRSPDLGKEERATVHAGLAPQGLPAVGEAGEVGGRAHVVEHPLPADRLPGHHLLRGTEAADGGSQEPR